MPSPDGELQDLRQLLADLTARVFRIEQALNLRVGVASEVAAADAPRTDVQRHDAPKIPSVPPAASLAQAQPIAVSAPATPRRIPPSAPDLESRIGSHWLNRIGISAVLIGVSYFLKFAFDNNWIGPTGRIVIGLIAGIAVVIWSERFRSRGYRTFSYSLKAVGIGVLYLSLWAAYQVYGLIPGGVAFATMLTVTVATAVMAWSQDAEILAAFALIGGFSTPLLLSTGENRELALFSYVAMLDLGSLCLVMLKPWRRLLVLSYAGTMLLYTAWYWSFYDRTQLGLTVGFATFFFSMFALAPLLTRPADKLTRLSESAMVFLAMVNAAGYFLQIYVIYREIDAKDTAWFALALAAVYVALSRQTRSQIGPDAARTLDLLHLALAIGFITVAIPIRLDAHWVTIGWFVESAVLLWVADKAHSELLNLFAAGALVLGVGRLLLIDNFYVTSPILNARMATYAVAIAVLGAVAWYGSRRKDEIGRSATIASVVALNLLALIGLSREVADYYSREMTSIPPYGRWRSVDEINIHHVEIARSFTYSALWMIYGAGLMIVGFWRRSAFVRWQALALIAFTIAKVFLYDVSELDRGYRIVSFIVLGALLLAISFVYQRDWLQLSGRKSPDQGPSQI